jgi:hypothetical protein
MKPEIEYRRPETARELARFAGIARMVSGLDRPGSNSQRRTLEDAEKLRQQSIDAGRAEGMTREEIDIMLAGSRERYDSQQEGK